MQLDSNKDQMWKYNLRIKELEGEIVSLKDTIKNLERRVMLNIKSQLLEAKEEFTSQQLEQSVDSNASKVRPESFNHRRKSTP